MKKRKSFLAILLFILTSVLIINLCDAEAPPHVIIINSETQQCTDYWSWDELPEGWIAYYPDYEDKITGSCIEGIGECEGKFQFKVNSLPEPYCWESKFLCENTHQEAYYGAINTEYGKCYFFKNEAESCCSELGLTYVQVTKFEGDDIINDGSFYKILAIILPLIIIIVLIAFFVIIITFAVRRTEKRSKKK